MKVVLVVKVEAADGAPLDYAEDHRVMVKLRNLLLDWEDEDYRIAFVPEFYS